MLGLSREVLRDVLDVPAGFYGTCQECARGERDLWQVPGRAPFRGLVCVCCIAEALKARRAEKAAAVHVPGTVLRSHAYRGAAPGYPEPRCTYCGLVWSSSIHDYPRAPLTLPGEHAEVL
jgi:hypothetical protein